jgi:hypothetical protein
LFGDRPRAGVLLLLVAVVVPVVLGLGAAPAVRGPDGASVTVGDPVVAGTAVRQPLGALNGGRYAIEYRVLSADGHPVAGSVSFTAAPPETESPSPSSTTPAAPSQPYVAVPARTADITHGDRAGWWPYPVIGLSIVVLTGVGVLLARRRTRHASSKGT